MSTTRSNKKYNAFNKIDLHTPIFMGVGRILRPDNDPIVVNAANVNSLLNRSDCLTATVDGKSYKILRFLLKTNGELVFGAEGGFGGHIGVHYQLDNKDPLKAKCITAGNAFFDENNKLCILNHQSGDFRPPVDSLQFAVDKIATSNLPISNELMIHEIDSDANVINKYVITREMLDSEDKAEIEIKEEVEEGNISPLPTEPYSNTYPLIWHKATLPTVQSYQMSKSSDAALSPPLSR